MITVWYPASIQLVLWKVSDLTSKAIKFQPIIWPLELSVIELQCAFKNRQPGDMKSICPQKKMMHWRRRQGRPYFRKFYLSGLPFISLMILASPFTFWVFQKYLLYENNHLCPKWVVVGIKKTKSWSGLFFSFNLEAYITEYPHKSFYTKLGEKWMFILSGEINHNILQIFKGWQISKTLQSLGNSTMWLWTKKDL